MALSASFNYNNVPVKLNSDANYKAQLHAAKATMKQDNPFVTGFASPEEGASNVKDWGANAAQRITMLKDGTQYTGYNEHDQIYRP